MTTESPARPGRIDTDALRRRYAEERDKRLRPDGNDQYLRLTGEFANYLDDPYTPWTERAPRTDHRTVVYRRRVRRPGHGDAIAGSRRRRPHHREGR